jgi:hypothetical protein
MVIRGFNSVMSKLMLTDGLLGARCE